MRWLALSLLVLAACGSAARAPAAHDAAAADEPVDAAPAPRVMPGVGGPVGVYLSVGDDYRTAPVVVLDERGARVVPGSAGLHAAPRSGGGAWLSGKDLVFAWDGEALTPMPKPPGAACCSVFIGPGDALWAYDGAATLARWDGEAWEAWTSTSLGVGDRWLAVGASATRVHAIGARALASFDDGVWTRRPVQALGPQESLKTLSVTADDHVVLTTKVEPRIPPNLPRDRANVPDPDGNVFTLVDGTFTRIAIPVHHYSPPIPQVDGTLLHLIKTGSVRLSGTTADKLDDVLGWDRAEAITPDGTIWASRGQVAGVLRARPDGTRDEPAPLSTLQAIPGHFVADDRGRLWVTLEPSGLAVIEGDSITVLPAGSWPLLAGRIQWIAIPRGAPALPAWPAPRRVSVHGRVIDAKGRPIRGAQIETCWLARSHETFFEPCTAGDDIVAFHRTTTTDATGAFRFDDLPAGALAVYGRKRGARWATKLATPDTTSGATDVALGDVTLTPSRQ